VAKFTANLMLYLKQHT